MIKEFIFHYLGNMTDEILDFDEHLMPQDYLKHAEIFMLEDKNSDHEDLVVTERLQIFELITIDFLKLNMN